DQHSGGDPRLAADRQPEGGLLPEANRRRALTQRPAGRSPAGRLGPKERPARLPQGRRPGAVLSLAVAPRPATDRHAPADRAVAGSDSGSAPEPGRQVPEPDRQEPVPAPTLPTTAKPAQHTAPSMQF